MKKKHLLTGLCILVLFIGFSFTAIAGKAKIIPGGPFVPPDQEVNMSSIMTFDEFEAELLKLEERSKGLLVVDTADYTQENRPLYIAKMGWGPVRMWIQGRIHGNRDDVFDRQVVPVQALRHLLGISMPPGPAARAEPAKYLGRPPAGQPVST